MANLKFRYFTVLLLLAVTATAVSSLQYVSSQDDEAAFADLQAIPVQIGEGWLGQDFRLEEMVYDILETRAIIHRSYVGQNGQDVFLSVVHYSDTKVDFHAPEACFGGSGLKTVKTSKTITYMSGDGPTTLDVAKLVTTRPNGKTVTYYFYKSGDFLGSNYIKMRLNIAANKLLRNDAKGSLIRISTVMRPGHEAEAESLLIEFLQDLLPYVHQSL
jgi:EpsI family protein